MHSYKRESYGCGPAELTRLRGALLGRKGSLCDNAHGLEKLLTTQEQLPVRVDSELLCKRSCYTGGASIQLLHDRNIILERGHSSTCSETSLGVSFI